MQWETSSLRVLSLSQKRGLSGSHVRVGKYACLGVRQSWVQILVQPLDDKVKVKVAQSCPTLCDPMDYTVHGILQARILEWVAFPFSGGSSQPRSPALQADSLPAEPEGKPNNTGVGSLSLLQWIFPTQGSNRGLLHCRQILYQLTCQGSPSWW